MFDNATPPSHDEFELTVFGPGYGESIVAHIGNSEWIIVDSCHGQNKEPVAKAYLNSIGVEKNSVKYIVVSHWHDDHTRGISELADYYDGARIGVSNVLNTREGKVFAAAYSGRVTDQTRGTKELYTIFKNHKARVEPLAQYTSLVRSANGTGFVQALSPTAGCFQAALAKLFDMIPTAANPPVREATQFSPNNEAVVLHIDTGSFSVLLGSDLETDNHGWSTLVQNPRCIELRAADLYKVAHHGSDTAEHAGIWSNLLAPTPVSILTPFNRGSVKLPKDSDKQRITANSLNFHTSSQGSAKAVMDSKIARRLQTMGSAPLPLNTKLGGVRSRKKLNDPSGAHGWSIMYFGAAGRI